MVFLAMTLLDPARLLMASARGHGCLTSGGGYTAAPIEFGTVWHATTRGRAVIRPKRREKSEPDGDPFEWDFVSVWLLVLAFVLIAWMTSEMWLPHWGTR